MRVAPPGSVMVTSAVPGAVSPGITKLTWPVEANTPYNIAGWAVPPPSVTVTVTPPRAVASGCVAGVSPLSPVIPNRAASSSGAKVPAAFVAAFIANGRGAETLPLKLASPE